MISFVRKEDFGAITKIYNYYIGNSVATFEETPVSMSDMEQRILQVTKSGLPWLVAKDQKEVVGYAYASNWNPRSAYQNSVQITVYLSSRHTKQGWGSRLYSELFEELRHLAKHTAIAGIALPNAGSVALHEKFGMKKVAHFEQVGFKFNRWLDVGYWQVMLDK